VPNWHLKRKMGETIRALVPAERIEKRILLLRGKDFEMLSFSDSTPPASNRALEVLGRLFWRWQSRRSSPAAALL